MRHWPLLLSALGFLACHDPAGSPILTAERPLPPSERCPFGATATDRGPDDDGDGVLDADEVESTEEVCLVQPLTREDAIPPGEECSQGGRRLSSGADDDHDGVLDNEEIERESVVCNIPEVWDGNLIIDEDTDVAALAGVRVVTGNVYIDQAAAIALPGLETVMGDLTIDDQPTGLALPALREVGGYVLSFAIDVENLDFPVLEQVGGEIYIEMSGTGGVSAPALTELGGGLTFWNTARGRMDFPVLRHIGDNLTIHGRVTSVDFRALETIGERLEVNDLALEVLRLPVLRELGRLDLVAAGPLHQLDLPVLEAITGDVLVDGTNLTGFAAPALTRVGGKLELNDGHALAAVDLPVLATVGDSLFVSNFPVLASATFPALVQLGRSGTVLPSVLWRNNGGTELHFPVLAGTEGGLLVMGNPDLATVRFDVLATTESLDVQSNPAITSLDFPALTTITGMLRLTGNDVLASLDGLAALTTLGGDFVVTLNPLLPAATIDALRTRLGK